MLDPGENGARRRLHRKGRYFMRMPEPDARILCRRSKIIEGLGEIVPPEGLITEEDAMRPYECDGLTAYRQLPMIVVLPRTLAETFATAAIGIMLTGVVSGQLAFSYGMEFVTMVAYGALGLALMWLTRLIFDRVVLPKLSVRAEIADGNIAVATVEAGKLVATASMVRAVVMK